MYWAIKPGEVKRGRIIGERPRRENRRAVETPPRGLAKLETPMTEALTLITGPEIAAYGFPGGHPFGPDRHDAFVDELRKSAVWDRTRRVAARAATREELEYFHTPRYVDRVAELSRIGTGYLDQGDTPAFPGVFEAASHVVGGTLTALEAIVAGPLRRAFIPIGGLHHAARDGAAGFCVFNDCGIAAEAARRIHGLERIAYVDIDAHHGDGIFYGFEYDPQLIFADLHEDGRFLYPGTGSRDETGRGAAAGTKLNIPMLPGSGDDAFFEAWDEVEAFVDGYAPELILFQCGADSLGGDPITHLGYTEAAHAHAAMRLAALADRHSEGRILAMGGGGYSRPNLARAWTRVVEALIG
jgi:acetoin utilization protein AcuC